MSVTIWHNPRCSKSRQTLQLLQDRGIQPVILEYLKTPPDAAAVRRTLDLLNLSPRELMRSGEQEYKDQNLSDPSLSDDQLIAAMVATPKLIQRPVVFAGNRAAIGRPPESVLDIL